MENEVEIIEPAPRSRCKNCGEKLTKRGKFCPACGQRDFDGRVKMRDLLSKFFSSLTHLDNKFAKMAWQLLVPGKVTIHYFQGKIKRYPHPVQFFFIVMFFFLLMFSKQFNDLSLNLFGGSINIGNDKSFSSGDGSVTVTKSNLYDALQRCMVAKEYRSAYDSLPEAWRTETTRNALDSIHRMASKPWEQSTIGMLNLLNDNQASANSTLDSVNLNLGVEGIQISTMDFVSLEPDSIIRKYGYKDWEQQIIIKQGIKAVKDQHGLINRYVGSFGWAVLVLIAFMALLLKLLYWKRGGYYVEHFIFLMHQQSGAFLFLTIVLLIHEFLFSLEWGWLVVLGWLGISPLIAMHRYYGEKWWKSIYKWLIYIAFYVAGLIFLFIATMLVVFVIF